MDKNWKATLLGTAALSLPVAALAAGGALPVTSINAYTNGVAYFEHAGTVDGDGELVLPATAADMDDLLQSLVLLDLDGGSIHSVRYETEDGAGGNGSAPDVSGNPALARLLLAAQGEEVEAELASGTVVSGRIVSIERVSGAEGEERNLLLLAAADGLRRVALEDVTALSFTAENLQEELVNALADIAAARGATDRSLRIAFRGDGERRVRIGYVRALPVWKTSWRLVLDEDGTAQLQGFALLDNTTDTDLEDVRVTFTAGQPVSFVTRLYQALHVERPYIDPPVTRQAAAPPVYAESFARALAAAPVMAEYADTAAEEAEDSGFALFNSSGAQASGSRAGVTFRYEVKEPITLAAGESAMIPVVQAVVPAGRLSLFDSQAGSGSNPIRAVRLDNDTGLHLAAGTVTVFERDSFTGTARLPDVLPGGEPLLAFAADQSVSVRREATSEPERVVSATISDGLLVSEASSRFTTTYELSRSGTEDGNRLVLIQQPRRSGYRLSLPDGVEAEENADSWRFPVLLGADLPGGDVDGGSAARDGQLNCSAGSSCTLTVQEERLESRRVELSRLTEDELLLVLSDTQLDEDASALLGDLLANGRELRQVERRLTALEGEMDGIYREQSRIRANMAELADSSDLYARYVRQFEAQEDRLEELAAEQAALREQRAALQAAREDLLR